MTWQPEAAGTWPGDPERHDGLAALRGYGPYRYEELSPPPRGRGRAALFGVLLAIGLCGLAVSAFGIAHQLLPRQFTVAEQRQILTWQMTGRWRAESAGQIFPQTVRYDLPGYVLDSSQGLVLAAHRLGIATKTSCAAGLTPTAARILVARGCSAVLRATYVDSSGSLVATVAVAVLPSATAARMATGELTGSPGRNPALVRSLKVARTAAAHFGNAQRQLSGTIYSGPYVIMTTAGFADGRHKVRMSADRYLGQEMLSLVQGLSGSAGAVLGRPPATPVCPGAPGC